MFKKFFQPLLKIILFLVWTFIVGAGSLLYGMNTIRNRQIWKELYMESTDLDANRIKYQEQHYKFGYTFPSARIPDGD